MEKKHMSDSTLRVRNIVDRMSIWFAFHDQKFVFYGQMSVFCGQMSVFCGQMFVFCGQMSVFYGPMSVFCGQMFVFCGQAFVFCWQMSVFTVKYRVHGLIVCIIWFNHILSGWVGFQDPPSLNF